jgi:DNA-directed RNA polymerase specialized sigma subunit
MKNVMSHQGMPSILETEKVAPPFSGTPNNNTPDFTAAYDAWKAKRTPENNTALLRTVQPILDTAVSSYASNSSPTMRSRAKLLALEAMDSYDPKSGNIKNHLLSRLQRLRRLSGKEQNIIAIPEQVGLDFQKIDFAENELRDQLSRDPTDEELADFTGLSVKRLRNVRNFNKPVSTGATTRATDEASYSGEISSNIPNKNTDVDAWLDFVYEDLNSVDKLIMDMSLGRNGRRRAPVQDIAKRLNISPGAVSQRAAKIQTMIDRRHTHGF